MKTALSENHQTTTRAVIFLQTKRQCNDKVSRIIPENPKITETILQVFLRSMARKPDPDKSHCGAGQWTIFSELCLKTYNLDFSIS